MVVESDQVPPNHYLRFGVVPRIYRFAALGIATVLGVAAMAVNISTAYTLASGHGAAADILFPMAYTAGVVTVGYVLCYRMVYWIDVRAGRLSWRTPLRKGILPISTVRLVTSGRGLSTHYIWICTDRQRLMLGPGIPSLRFGERLTHLYPAIRLQIDDGTRQWLQMQKPLIKIIPWASQMVREGTD